MTKVCKCNVENIDSAKFCRSCGSPLEIVFPESIVFAANLNENFNSIGGKLIITPKQMIFKPHKVSFSLKERVFEIKDIVGYKKGWLTFLYISFLTGEIIKLTVSNKKKIINELEMRKAQLKS